MLQLHGWRRRRQLRFPLDEQQSAFLRARLDTEARRVLGFAVQLEVLIEESREIVLRFDTAHGYVHQHMFSREGPERGRRLKFRDWGEAYTYCYEYVRLNWERAIAQYLKGR